jgi:hypothetical protein
MFMRISIAHIFTWTAVAAFAGVASMQAAQQGRFHLPTEAHWGRTVLQPGDYTINLPIASTGELMLRVQGEGKNVFELPRLTNREEYSNSNYLTLQKIDGEYFVTSFRSGASGKTYDFFAPKPKHRELMSRDGEAGLALAVK